MAIDLTKGLAIWGAILSTILAILKIVEFYKDRANIKVRVKGGYYVYPANHPKNPYGDKSLVSITASNNGRRNVTLKKAGLLMPRGGKYLVPVGSIKSIELSEGKSHDYELSEDEIKQKGLTPDKYVAFVIDANGQYYWSHNFLKRLIKLHRIN
jgi:hypothetical protein